MKIAFQPTPSHYDAAQEYLTKKLVRPPGLVGALLKVFGSIAVLGLILDLYVLLRTLTDYSTPRREHVTLGLTLTATSILLLLPLLSYLAKRASTLARKAADPAFLESVEYEVTPEGLRVVTDRETSILRWKGLTAVVDDGRYLYVHRGPAYAHYIPASAFDSYQEYKTFAQALHEHTASGA